MCLPSGVYFHEIWYRSLLMDKFPSLTQCALFANLGVFRGILPIKHPLWPNYAAENGISTSNSNTYLYLLLLQLSTDKCEDSTTFNTVIWRYRPSLITPLAPPSKMTSPITIIKTPSFLLWQLQDRLCFMFLRLNAVFECMYSVCMN